MTPVIMQDGRYLPEVTISKKDCRARPSTYSPAVFTKDGRCARPSLTTLPGTDGTIGCQGPGVRAGRLGTLHAQVVELLLAREDVDTNSKNYRSQTALRLASDSGYIAVVRLVLSHGAINPNQPDSDRCTPLLRAGIMGRSDVVEILLERNDVDPNRPDFLARRPIHSGVPKRPGRPKCRTAVFGQDGGPHRVRHFSSGQGVDGGGLQGTAGDY